MVVEVLTPGVQHGGKPYLGSEMFWISSDVVSVRAAARH